MRHGTVDAAPAVEKGEAQVRSIEGGVSVGLEEGLIEAAKRSDTAAGVILSMRSINAPRRKAALVRGRRPISAAYTIASDTPSSPSASRGCTNLKMERKLMGPKSPQKASYVMDRF